MHEKPVLYVFSGLPGAGKTVLSRRLAQSLQSAYLRIDTIEQGLRDLCNAEVVAEGYRLAYAIAADNLLLGASVIADSCNPIQITRDEWSQVAINAGSNLVNIEVRCSDRLEHRQRVENRTPTIPNLVEPTWRDVESRRYDAWKSDRIVIDTAGKTVDESFEELMRHLDANGSA